MSNVKKLREIRRGARKVGSEYFRRVSGEVVDDGYMQIYKPSHVVLRKKGHPFLEAFAKSEFWGCFQQTAGDFFLEVPDCEVLALIAGVEFKHQRRSVLFKESSPSIGLCFVEDAPASVFTSDCIEDLTCWLRYGVLFQDYLEGKHHSNVKKEYHETMLKSGWKPKYSGGLVSYSGDFPDWYFERAQRWSKKKSVWQRIREFIS